MRIMISLIVSLLTLQVAISQTLYIELENIRNSKGQILLSFYHHYDEWMNEELLDQQIIFPKTDVNEGKMIIEINELKPCIYSIALSDDEISDEKMNYNFLGLPKEGYGFSNNFKVKLRKPRFEECSFYLKNDTTISIHLQY